MYKKVLAAVIASVVSSQAMAIVVLDDGTNKFTINGRVGARFQYQKRDGENNTQQRDDGSRFGFIFESKLNEDFTAFARTEWGFDATRVPGADGENDSALFWNRLGYAGIQHSEFGSLSAGKQYGAFYQVASWTDWFATEGGSTLGIYGTQGELNGTSRSENVAYNISTHGLNLHASFQNGRSAAQHAHMTRTRDYSYGLAASYDLPMGLSVGVAWNHAKFVEANRDDAKIFNVSIKYDQGPLYTAFGFTHMKNHGTMNGRTVGGDTGESVAEKAQGMEFYAGYRLTENFKVEAGYNGLKDKADQFTDTRVKYFPVAGVFNVGPVQLAASYAFESSKRGGVDVEDRFQIQARYYF